MATRGDEDSDDRLPFFWWTVVLAAVVVAAALMYRQDTNTSGIGERAPVPTAAPVVSEDDLMSVLSSFGGFDVFIRAIEVSGLRPDLVAPGELTLFAPTDAAFAVLAADVVEGLFADPRALRSLVLGHSADGLITGGALASTAQVTMRSGDVYEVGDGGSSVGPARILIQDRGAHNGVIHGIDRVLLPRPAPSLLDALTADPRFGTLVEAIRATDLTTAVGRAGVTLLAPTDAAFEALPAGVLERLLADPERLRTLLSHHLLPDGLDFDAEGSRTVASAGGTRLELEVSGGSVSIGDVDAEPGSVPGLFELPRLLVPPDFALATVNEIIDLEPITFAVGSAELTTEGEAELDRVVEYLIENPVRLEVGGHTDSDGAEEINQSLSEARADVVRDHLVDGGVDPERIRAVGYGESRPVADNDSAEGRARNRRIEFTILG